MAPFTSHRHINTVEKIYVYEHVVSIKKEKKPFKVQVRTKFFFWNNIFLDLHVKFWKFKKSPFINMQC